MYCSIACRATASGPTNCHTERLEEYEAKLGLVRRYLAITAEAEAGLRALDGGNIDEARRCLTNIMRIER